MPEKADVQLLCGDVTDTGRVEEAEVLAEELRSCSIPVVAVLGNHDYERQNQNAIRKTQVNADVNMLEAHFDSDYTDIKKIAVLHYPPSELR